MPKHTKLLSALLGFTAFILLKIPLAASALSVEVGKQVTISVSASGTAPFTYQWRKDGVNIGGATGGSYSISSVAPSSAGSYTAVVSNAWGSVTSDPAVLTVTGTAALAPAIAAQPVSLTVAQGNTASFSVTATGTNLTYQWRKNGAVVSGATGQSYSISSVQAADAGSYTVVVSNSAGSATSSAATLTVNSAVNLTELPPSSYMARGENGTGEGLAKLFDGDVATKWLDFSSTSWIKIVFAKPAMLEAYSITSANDHSERDPASWTLSGSNDGVNWTVIEKRSGQSWGSRFQTRDFAFAQKTGAYTQFRFDFQATSGSIVQLAELECYGTQSGTTTSSPVQVVPTSYSARGENGSGEGLAKLFDGDASSKWLDFSGTTWVKMSFAKPTMLDAYTLTSANDHVERDPVSWTFSGSNDGVNWTVIDSRSGQSWASRFQARDFVLAQRTAAYTYFRFEFRATSGSITQLAELELTGVQSGATTTGSIVEVVPAAYSARGENGAGEGLAKLFDGDASTKWLDFSGTTWVRMSFSKPTMLEAYSLTSANDYVERDPVSWTLSGSNDGVTWTVIESRTGQTWQSRFLTRDFALAQRTAAYTYFQFSFQAQAGGITQLAELELFGVGSN